MPQGIQEAFDRWGKQAKWLRVVHVALLMAACMFSILTASQISGKAGPLFAVLAALSVGVLTALDLGVKANGLRNAWRHMNAAIARYQTSGAFTAERLIEAYEQAEALIGDLPSGPRPAMQLSPTGQLQSGERESTAQEKGPRGHRDSVSAVGQRGETTERAA